MSVTLGRAKLAQADFVSNRYTDFVRPGLVVEDVMSNDYWREVVGMLRVHDVVSCIAADGSFEVDLRLLSKLPSGAVSWRVIREWRPPVDDVADDHVIVCRNPQPGATGWTLAIGGGSAPWRFGLAAIRAVCTREAVEMLISRDVSINLTIYTGNPQDVLDNPDIVPTGFDATILCPESAGDRSRWAVLHRNANSGFKVGQIFAGGSVTKFLRDIAADASDSPFDKSTTQIRPHLVASELLATTMTTAPKKAA